MGLDEKRNVEIEQRDRKELKDMEWRIRCEFNSFFDFSKSTGLGREYRVLQKKNRIYERLITPTAKPKLPK